jgi:hypothetical protein
MKYSFLLPLILLSACATSSIPVLSPGLTHSNNLPNINDAIWSDIHSWPKSITKGDIAYEIVYSGKTKNNEDTFNINEFDFSRHYSARYVPARKANRKYKEVDYFYGPFFCWRPDGSIYYKSIWDENQRYEAYYFYKNGDVAFQEFIDLKRDIWTETWFDDQGNILGYCARQYELTWYKSDKEDCRWEDRKLSHRDFVCERKSFKIQNKDQIW